MELARRLQEEATCSICLDYFTDPVMTACGHNFCRECIQMSWEKGKGKKGKKKQKGSFPCPECREMSPQRNLRPNRLLTKVAEMARQHPGLQKRDLCQAHQEPLKLFCQDDQNPICVVCREAQEHRMHRVLPLDEAAREYKVSGAPGVASPRWGVRVQSSWPYWGPSLPNKSAGTNRVGGGGEASREENCLGTATTEGSILCLQNKIGV